MYQNVRNSSPSHLEMLEMIALEGKSVELFKKKITLRCTMPEQLKENEKVEISRNPVQYLSSVLILDSQR